MELRVSSDICLFVDVFVSPLEWQNQFLIVFVSFKVDSTDNVIFCPSCLKILANLKLSVTTAMARFPNHEDSRS